MVVTPRSSSRGRGAVRAEISGLHTTTKRLANGAVRIYAYAGRGGELLTAATGRDLAAARTALERELGRGEVLAKLDALRDADTAITRRQSDRHIFGFVTAFLASPEFQKLAPSTKTAYRTYLERFRDEFGEDRVAMFEKAAAVEDLTDWRDQFAETPRAADYAMAAVSRLFSWGRSRGKTTAEPTKDVERLHRANRADIIWTAADLVALAARGGGKSMDHDGTLRPASAELMWAVRLGAYTGLRQGDLLRLPWSAVTDLAISRRTSKRARVALVPLIPAARELLAAIPRRSPLVLTSTRGDPWTSSGFRASFRKACIAAGVDKRFHDLRGTAATRLKTDTDLTNQEIADILAWSKDRVDTLMALYVSADVVALDMLQRMDRKRAATNRLQTGTDQAP